MAFQPVEYEFPDPDKDSQDDFEIELEPSSAKPVKRGGSAEEPKAETPKEETVIEEDDYEIELEEESPLEGKDAEPVSDVKDVTEEELDSYSRKVQTRIKQLSKKIHDERRGRESALRERQELEAFAQRLLDENKRLQQNTSKSQTALLEQAKRNVAAELEAAKVKYRQAYETGEADAVLDAQEALTSARLKAERLNNIKLPSLQDKEVPVETQQEVPTYNAPAPKVDAKAQAWQEANPWFGTDDEMTSFALGLHSKLVKTGVDPQSDEYYETINARIRKVFPENFDDVELEEDREEEPKRKANVVAPATRSTSPKKITLKPSQVAIAKKLGVPLDLYAEMLKKEMRKANG